MKDINKLWNEVKADADSYHIPYSNNIMSVTINTRAKRRWGQTRKVNGNYSINLNAALLTDNLDDQAAKNTLMHELLHTCPNCMNHGYEWQRWGKIVQSKSNGRYSIERTTSAEKVGIPNYHVNHYKYVLKCKKCGYEYKYMKLSKYVQNYEHCRCGVCKGALEFIEL